MLPAAESYEELQRNFRWCIPDFYNIGIDICDRHADGTGRVALLFVDDARRCVRYTFDDLKNLSDRFANVLRAGGITRGDRIGVLLPQSPETAVAHIAAFKSALVSIPLFMLFGEEALEFRLANSGAKALVTDANGLAKIAPIRDRLPDLARIYVVGANLHEPENNGIVSFSAVLERASAVSSPSPLALTIRP